MEDDAEIEELDSGQSIDTAPRNGTWFMARSKYGPWRRSQFFTRDGPFGQIDGPWSDDGISFLGATHWKPIE